MTIQFPQRVRFERAAAGYYPILYCVERAIQMGGTAGLGPSARGSTLKPPPARATSSQRSPILVATSQATRP